MLGVDVRCFRLFFFFLFLPRFMKGFFFAAPASRHFFFFPSLTSRAAREERLLDYTLLSLLSPPLYPLRIFVARRLRGPSQGAFPALLKPVEQTLDISRNPVSFFLFPPFRFDWPKAPLGLARGSFFLPQKSSRGRYSLLERSAVSPAQSVVSSIPLSSPISFFF